LGLTFSRPSDNGVAVKIETEMVFDDASDYGIFKGKVVGPGKINLPMTAAYYFANGDPNIGDLHRKYRWLHTVL